MDTGLDLFLRGLLIGLAVAIPVGPISLLCLHRTLAGGWRAGFAAGMGAATADAVYATATGLGLGFAPSVILIYSKWSIAYNFIREQSMHKYCHNDRFNNGLMDMRRSGELKMRDRLAGEPKMNHSV
jgi:hypothetical protein